MGTREAAVAMALTSLVLADPAQGIDQPIDAEKLVLKRSATKASLVFVSRDPAFLFPARESADDPATGTPGGASIDLFSANEGSAALDVPSGTGKPGWSVTLGDVPRYRFRNSDAPSGPSTVRGVVMRQGRLLRVVGRSVGLALTGAQGAVGIRIVTGTLRSCALFDSATVEKDHAGRFVAKDARASVLADCSDASLGGATPTTTTSSTAVTATTTTVTTTTSITTTTLPSCGIIPDPVEPMCGGACPPGERCVGQFGPSLQEECVCLSESVTPCAGSGYPACGGVCTAGRVCQGFHLLPGETPELVSCACVDPGNTCDDPAGTCFALGVCPPGEVCFGQGPPTSACGCGTP